MDAVWTGGLWARILGVADLEIHGRHCGIGYNLVFSRHDKILGGHGRTLEKGIISR
jgi:hypothetical protein